MGSSEHNVSSDDILSSTTANANGASEADESPTNESNNYSRLVSQTRTGDILKKFAGPSYVYRHDIVKNRKNSKIGIVTEVAGDSDSESSLLDDEDDDDENGEEVDGVVNEAGSNTEGLQNGEKLDCSSDADSNKSRHLQTDHVRVLWVDRSETTEDTNAVEVVDRGFLHGDYVAAASDPTGQIGVVVDVDVSVDLLAYDSSFQRNVSCRDLKRIREFTIGDYVVHGPWLGRIDDVVDNVTVLFDDGSVCKVVKVDPLRLKPVGKNILEDGHFPYYPGQRVRASSSSVFKNSRWLSGLWKVNRLEGTVTKVTIGSVFVYWIASAGYGTDASSMPAEEQNPKNLKLLSCFSHTNWELGDWCLLSSSSQFSSEAIDTNLRIEENDSAKDPLESTQKNAECDSEIVTSEESNEHISPLECDACTSSDGNVEILESKVSAESSSCGSVQSVPKELPHVPLHRKKIRKVVIKRDHKSKRKEEKFERASMIANTKTRVSVAWQDGTTEQGLSSTALIPIDTPGDHEFVPEQYVVEKASDDDDDASEIGRIGVIKIVNAKEKTACVRWLRQVTRADDPREFDNEEVVSVYQLEGHPDYDYCYGDVVVRLSPVPIATEDETVVSSERESVLSLETNGVMQEKEKQSGTQMVEGVQTGDSCTKFSDLSWVGHITGLKSGDIEVTWADGMISMVGPQAIYVVGRDDDESIAAGSDISDAASWETLEDGEMETFDNGTEDTGGQNTGGVSPEIEEGSESAENSGRNGALAIPLAALDFVSRLASGIFSRGRKLVDSESQTGDEIQSFGEAVRGDHDEGSSSQISNEVESTDNHSTDRKEEEQETPGTPTFSNLAVVSNLDQDASGPVNQDSDWYSFKAFDIIQDPCDHYFLGANEQNFAGRKWLKKVQQDWNILQNNLPDGIYVRAYEDRMALLRAVIVGAYGTPYQDGLFFFDFHLPLDYPAVPPSAYYHSGGWRLNPNLYEEGKVCLSLLNTWTGRGNEVWDPSSSSILQVLVSLQGLVLNAKPYFNEAGYDKQVGTAEGEKNSLSYNENAFLLNCKTMMYLTRKPPKDFEGLIREHFRKRGYYILKACDAYMKGQLIGSLSKDASISSDRDADSNSVGFKLMLAKIVPKLYSVLHEVGADCREFKHLQQS